MITRVNICAERLVSFLYRFLYSLKNCIYTQRGITTLSWLESGNLELSLSVTHSLPAMCPWASLSRLFLHLSNMGDVTSQDGCEDWNEIMFAKYLSQTLVPNRCSGNSYCYVILLAVYVHLFIKVRLSILTYNFLKIEIKYRKSCNLFSLNK